jgi:hypothetical protein
LFYEIEVGDSPFVRRKSRGRAQQVERKEVTVHDFARFHRAIYRAGESEGLTTELLDLDLASSVRHNGRSRLRNLPNLLRDQGDLAHRIMLVVDSISMWNLGPSMVRPSILVE